MSSPSKSFSLKLLGGCVLENATGSITGRAVQRRRLACLALMGAAGRAGASRDQVAAYLWPESNAEQARHLLSDTLYVLRSALGRDAILAPADRVILNPEIVACDVTAFRDALERGDPAAAAEAYGGPFLDGFHIADAPEFERWVDRERKRHDVAYAAAVEELALAAEQAGSPAALGWWWRLAGARPYDGSVARRLATALAAAGDRAGAIRQLEVHAALLKAELDLEPDPALAELAESLRRQPRNHAGNGAGTPTGAVKEETAHADTGPFASVTRNVPPAPDPTARHRTTQGRRRLFFGTMTLLVALGGYAIVPRRSGNPPVRRLAVLPFENLGDSSYGYFADGMTEAIRGKLTTIPGLRVTASYSSNQYRHTAKSPRQVGEELGVDYLLVGRIRWVKGPGRESYLQVSPELVDVRSTTDRWQQPFDAPLTDVFQVQADIANRVAEALGAALNSDARAVLARRPTQSLPAYNALLRGDQLLVTEGRLELDALEKGAAAYREAVRLDPRFGLAWARLAWAESYVYGYGRQTDSVAALAKDAADHALALAPDLGQTWNAIALIRGGIDLDGLSEISALERAHALAPHDVDILTQLAVNLAEVVGRLDEAVALGSEAARLDPRSPLVARRYAAILVTAGRFRAADSVGSAALKLAPDNLVLLGWVNLARFLLGDVAGARALQREALAHVPLRRLAGYPLGLGVPRNWLVDDSLRAVVLRFSPEAFGGDRAEGLAVLAELNWEAGRYHAARARAAEARLLLEQELRRSPADGRVMEHLAFAYAILGRCADAWRVRDRARLFFLRYPEWARRRDLAFSSFQIAARCGANAAAVAWTDTLLRLGTGTYVSRAWLRIDPGLAPLRRRPDFQRLLAEQ